MLCLPRILRDRTADKIPVLRRRPLIFAADAERQTVVFQSVDRFLPIAAGKAAIICWLCHDRKKSRAQGTEYGIVPPAAPCRLCGGAQKLCERMMGARTLCIQMAWDAAVGKCRQQEIRIGIHIAYENGNLTIAISLLACQAQYI